VEVIVIGCEGGTGLGEIETTHDEYPTRPFVPFLAGAFLVLVFAFVAFAGTTVFAHLSTVPDVAQVYDAPLALRFAPTLVHFVPEIDDVLEAVTSTAIQNIAGLAKGEHIFHDTKTRTTQSER